MGDPISVTGLVEHHKAYFFAGTLYWRYDIEADKLDSGYPQLIEDGWPSRSFGVYAAFDVPTTPDEDARLHDDNGDLVKDIKYPAGLKRGQAGWDLGINVGNIDQLLEKLRSAKQPKWLGGAKVGPGSITRLGIMAHGAPGRIQIYGSTNQKVMLDADVLAGGASRVKDRMLELEPYLAADATVLFVSCRAGFGESGTQLLLRLSQLWPGRKVVAFWTIGYVSVAKMARKGWFVGGTTEAGMRDTEGISEAVTVAGKAKELFELEIEQNWGDMRRFPWASESSLHARVARNGRIVHDTLKVKAFGGTPDP
jgi:hypothetical protein